MIKTNDKNTTRVNYSSLNDDDDDGPKKKQDNVGKYTFSSGDVIDAKWKKDVCISGTYNYVEDKNTYTGTFIHTNDQILPHGKGKYIFANGDVYMFWSL